MQTHFDASSEHQISPVSASPSWGGVGGTDDQVCSSGVRGMENTLEARDQLQIGQWFIETA